METSLESWRGAVNGVLYGVQFEEKLTNELASRMAPGLIRKPLAGRTAEGQYAELDTAVNVGTDLTKLIPDAHSEEKFRNFLSLLISQMDALRPWPEPPYTEINITQWSEFADPVLIARFPKSAPKVEHKIKTVFWRLEDIGVRAAVLGLKSGTVVAFVDRWWPESNAIAVVTQGQQNPDAVITELTEATDLTTDDFEFTEPT